MIKLSPSQMNVVEEFPEFLSNDDTEMTISGFAGSGKSFLVKYLADISDKQQRMLRLVDRSVPLRKLHFTATTNKAASVLEEMLENRRVNTIHKLLGLVVHNDRRTGKQKLIEKSRVTNLNHSIVFIDESSMINFELLAMIRKAQEKFRDCKIVFIGDAYQLPPVMEDVCPVFNPNAANVFFLKEIQRQVADNPIIQLSAEYRNVLDNHELDWPVIPHDGKHILFYRDKKEFFNKIEEAYTHPHEVNDYKIVAWSNQRVRAYNRWIRKLQGNTEPFEIGDVMISNKPLFSGDQIMASTDTIHTIENVTPATNFDIEGFWIELDAIEESFFQPLHWDLANVLVRRLASEAKLSRDWSDYFEVTQQWADLRPVHASTVHKAQGSTYKEVFVDLRNIGTNTRWQEVARLVYVGITRASDKVHIFGELCMNYNKQPPVNLMEAFENVHNL